MRTSRLVMHGRTMLELLLRERRASGARAKTAADRSKEERDFVEMDRVLHPEVYQELDRMAEEIRRAQGGGEEEEGPIGQNLEDDRSKDKLGYVYEQARGECVEDRDKEEVRGRGLLGDAMCRVVVSVAVSSSPRGHHETVASRIGSAPSGGSSCW